MKSGLIRIRQSARGWLKKFCFKISTYTREIERKHPNKEMLVIYLIQTLSTDWILNIVIEKSEILPRFHLSDCKNGGFFIKI